MNLSDEITKIKGIGDKTNKLFQKLDIATIDDLLMYFPKDYVIFPSISAISSDSCNKIIAFQGVVSQISQVKKVRNLLITTIKMRVEDQLVSATFFNMPYITKILKSGTFHVFYGYLFQKNSQFCIEQPKVFSLQEYTDLQSAMQPKYGLTAGLTNKTISKAIATVLNDDTQMPDYLSQTMRDQLNLITSQEAITHIHFPKNQEEFIEARKRLVFDEFFQFTYLIQNLRKYREKVVNLHPMIPVSDTSMLLQQLPYQLTNAQIKVWNQIEEDLSSPKVMNRLVQGDVGSGKTIIAFLSLLMAAANGYQGALMAPTEVLAMQHFDSLQQLCEQHILCIKPVLLTGSMTAKEKKAIYQSIQDGTFNVIIGTHALIQDKVTFKNLGLVVTDEQHRFGVRQRELLNQKGENVPVLVMSATPIPRTLAIILYGDLDISVINELPANRLPIKNCVMKKEERDKIYRFIEKEIEKGRQIYIICPMVEEGEIDYLENVVDYSKKLSATLPSQIQIQYLHGKMSPKQKNQIMEDFHQKNIDVLISTTVIEVGINVPNASVMVIENAERFGLAQLHQLRGRVGRGKEQSYCIFVNGNDNKKTTKRLDIINHSNDGFYIANEDLKLRGPGDLFGFQQSGAMNFKIADIYTDALVLESATNFANKLVNKQLNLPKNDKDKIENFLYAKRFLVDFKSI